MNITVIGPGRMGSGLVKQLTRAGHRVLVTGRNAAKAEALARKHGARAVSAPDAAVSDVIIVATGYAEAVAALKGLSNSWNKVVVDITNPVDFSTMSPAVAPGTSGAEEIAKAAPAGAKVVKAFNTTFAGTLVPGQVAGQPLDVLIAGDDADAKATVSRLVEAGGLRAIDAGPLQRARQLEALGLLHMALQFTLNTGFSSAVKILA